MSTIPDHKHLNDNRDARERLQRIVAGLSDADLAHPLEGGWTVASALVHLAFWDHRQLALLKRWESGGVTPAPSDPETINAAVHALAAAIPPRAAIDLALSAAEAIDAEVQNLKPDLVAAIESAGYPFVLRRSVHRNAHLDDIEHALARPTPGQH
ncbi:MAG: maleylpyruvate isomerase N-terminal domain-containing protein [Chloroflexi bacterium]|nr:maleylpyruvate isomerase N-terminal domain-containing protein [Chloroflexota bacterium]MCL5275743.1 maleylpyruvate isomerase N-terminal domain-containing protein [Chloroflexota bacterium]